MIRNRNKWPQVASAFAIGLGAGAALGLFAPQSGDDTRDQIRSTAQDGVDELTDRGKTVIRRVRKNMADAKDFVNEVADAGENAFRDARSATMSSQNHAIQLPVSQHGTASARPRLGRTRMNLRSKGALHGLTLDDRRHSHHSLAAWARHFVHAGRIRPHSPRDRHYRHSDSRHPGSSTRLDFRPRATTARECLTDFQAGPRFS